MIEVVERRKDGYESDVSDEGFDEEKSQEEKSKFLNPGLRYIFSQNYL